MVTVFIIFALIFVQFSTSIVFENDSHRKRESDQSFCDQEFTENIIVLRSPNYPKSYPPNTTCTYMLKGPNCQRSFKFEFLDFDLEDSQGCIKDRLEIDQLDALCGSKNYTKTYLAKNGSLELRLRTDDNVEGKGFKISVTRLPCEKQKTGSEEAETKKVFETAAASNSNNTILTNPRSISVDMSRIRHCCHNVYNSKNFFIASPGFPYTLNQKEECVYKIQKSNSNICALRLNLVFFWLGPSHPDRCPYGFLKVDGQDFCGCNQQIQFTTSFDQSYTKYLYFKSEGFNLNSQSGFVVEVTQEECSTEYYSRNLDISRRRRSFEDEINRIVWPLENGEIDVHKLNLVKEVVEDRPLITKSVYVFSDPDDNSFINLPENIDSIPEVSSNLLVSNPNAQCIIWNKIQLDVLQKAFAENLTCIQDRDSDNCVELDFVKGYFKSPGYPYWYPNDLNLCYRFRKQPGYCWTRVFFDDFYLEDSHHCKKDFLLFGDYYRYCGHSLYRKTLTFDLRNKFFEDVRFVSDSFYTCRGFSGTYHQIACQDSDYPVNPVDPITPKRICDDVFIQDETFLIGVVRDYQMCSFRIRKSSKDVCKIELNFEKLYLDCNVETVTVDGIVFCGNKTGRTVTITFNNREEIDVVFRSTLTNDYDDLKFKITGQQIINSCYIPDPTPERISVQHSANVAKHHMDGGRPRENSSYLIKMFDKLNFRDICAIISRSTNNVLEEDFCDILSENLNAALCVPMNWEEINNMSFNTQILEMKVRKAETVEKIEFSEIDCNTLI